MHFLRLAEESTAAHTHQQYIHLAWQFLHVNYRENGISEFWHNFLHVLSLLTDVFHHLHFLLNILVRQSRQSSVV